MSLLFREDEMKCIKDMIRGGTIKGLIIFDNEDGVVQRVVNTEQEAALWIKNNEPKDDVKYSSILVSLLDIVSNKGHLEI